MAYSGFGGGSADSYASVMQQPSYQPQPQPKPMIIEQPKPMASPGVPPDAAYNPPPAMYAKQSPYAIPGAWNPQESIWDRFAGKKVEVFKLVVLSLVFLLAFSFDHLLKHYLDEYIASGFLSANQELLVRLCYPVSIILVLWIIKVFA